VISKLKNADEEIEKVSSKIVEGFKGGINNHVGHLPGMVTAFAYPLYKNGRKTSKFMVSEACVGCGICAKGCPVKAIEIIDKRPVWVKDKCVLCLKCLHRCPKKAIDYGNKTKDNGRYTNPNDKEDE